MAPNLIVGGDGAQTLVGTGSADLIYGFDPNGAAASPSSITATRVASGLSQPLFVTAAPDDPSRIFVVEKTGRIKIIDLSGEESGVFTVKATPFLDLTMQISAAGESGLLGLAFDPDYAQNGFFYVNLINTAGDTEIRRYQVSGNPDIANAASALLVITVDQPSAQNHKAGWLGFGPDGMLYAALGDGGADASTAQDVNSLLGKILRLNVDLDDFTDPNRNYAIPPGNPFAGATAGADEIFAMGLRNPWRDSFDRATGTLFIADVGAGSWEEIDIGAAGANYGWPLAEGPAGSQDPSLTRPIFFYDHGVGSSITGGYVYRGQSEQLHGQYFFADFITEFVATLRLVNGTWVSTNRTAQIAPNVGTLDSISSFGEDARGNLYIVDIGGEVFRLTPTGTSFDGAGTIAAGAGDDWVFAGAGGDTVDGDAGNDMLAGMAGDDSLDGGAGNDRLDGGAGNDILRGLAGTDILTGAAGDDRFLPTPGGGSDIVTDFMAGLGGVDKILLTEFPAIRTLADVLARASQVGANAVIDFGGGDILTLRNVSPASLSADDFVFAVVPGDLNSDGRSDVLWRHQSGFLVSWEINSGNISGYNAIGSRSLDWEFADTGDFNADGRADVLWRNDNGVAEIWEMSGGQILAVRNLGFIPNDWQIADTGFFNGDRASDILWRHDSGALAIWTMSSGQRVGYHFLGVIDSDWRLIETGDFNGDGQTDLSWRHTSGAVALWDIVDAAQAGYHFVSPVGNEWHLADTGDFNGDGRDDILWRHESGQLVSWELSAGRIVGFHDFGVVTNDYQIEKIGDFNADGRDDILWRHDLGQVVTWELNGGQIVGYHDFGTVASEWLVR